MKIDKYLSYELLMLIDLLHRYEGTFSMNEKGNWVATIRPFQYQGTNWDAYSFRQASFYLISKMGKDC